LGVWAFLVLYAPFVFSQGQGPFLYYNMKTQAFPESDEPGALVYVPSTYNVSSGLMPLNFAVYVHGFHNCISNCVLLAGQGTNCSVGQPARMSYSLIKQIEAAKIPALLLLPEVEYDMASSNPGQFGRKNGWNYFMTELLQLLVNDMIIPAWMGSLNSINRMAIFSHSGAYDVTASIAAFGGVPQVSEIVLLDSLYADFTQFNDWIELQATAHSFGTNSSAQYIWGNVYTDNGGTYDNSITQANVTASVLTSFKESNLLLFDNTYDTLPANDYIKYPVIFKRSELAHDSVPVYYFQQFIQASPWLN